MNNKFVDYLVLVVAIGGGIVGVKVLANIAVTHFPNKVVQSANGVIQLM
jgi:hypothetical protein